MDGFLCPFFRPEDQHPVTTASISSTLATMAAAVTGSATPMQGDAAELFGRASVNLDMFGQLAAEVHAEDGAPPGVSKGELYV
jgi:hypothetical protein